MMTTERPQAQRVSEKRPLWPTMLWVAIGGALVSLTLPMVLAVEFAPFLAALAVPLVIAACTAKWPRAFAVVVGVVCVFELAGGIGTIVDTLQHPESVRDFVPLLLFGLSTSIGIAAAVPAYRRTPADQAARVILVGCAVVFTLGAVVSGIAALRLPDVAIQAGDIELTTSNAKFDTDTLALGSSGALYVTNDDSIRHTFTIDALGIDEELPGKRSTRFVVEGAPGTYEYYCRPHPGMTGELTIP